LGFSVSTVSLFSELQWKWEFCIVLWSFVEALRCSSQKTSRLNGKMGTVLSWQCQTPYSPSNRGENSRFVILWLSAQHNFKINQSSCLHWF
jgi:hypothetical protein